MGKAIINFLFRKIGGLEHNSTKAFYSFPLTSSLFKHALEKTSSIFHRIPLCKQRLERNCICFGNSDRMRRHFATIPSSSLSTSVEGALLQKTKNPDYKVIPFVREDLEKVMAQVPDFKYYYIGNENMQTYPYESTGLDASIIPPNSYPEYKEFDTGMHFSRLENGLRIVSADRGGLTTSFGLFVHAGTRMEDITNFGVCSMIQALSFHSTAHLSWLRTVKTIEVLGATASCVAGREHMVYSGECLRQDLPLLIPMITGNILFPRFLPWEIENNKSKLLSYRHRLLTAPDQMISELLHTTAWHNNSLGHKLYPTDRSLEYFHQDTMRLFMLQHFSPDNMVFVGINTDHKTLCDWLMRAFVDYNAIPPQKRIISPPVYTGGDVRMEMHMPHAHIAVAFETPGGWRSDDLVSFSVLQTLLGGGGAFSTGGPGKGMYTRLYLDILNKYDWVESAMAFNTQYTDSGIFGLYILSNPLQSGEAVKVMCDEFAKMREVSNDELQRAKNSLRSSIYMNLECKNIQLEDVGRQILMTNKIISPQDFCNAIDKVTPKDILKVVNNMLSKPPTVVAYGDVSTVPHYEEIRAQLKKSGAQK